MLIKLLRWILRVDSRTNETLEELRKIPGFKSVKDLEKTPTSSAQEVIPELKKRESEIIYVPDFFVGKGFRITKWNKQPGEIIESGDVVCELENKDILMEFESFYAGRLELIGRMNRELLSGDELFRIQGV